MPEHAVFARKAPSPVIWRAVPKPPHALSVVRMIWLGLMVRDMSCRARRSKERRRQSGVVNWRSGVPSGLPSGLTSDEN